MEKQCCDSSKTKLCQREEGGYVLEVDIAIPDALHDALDDLPLAPVRVAPCSEKTSAVGARTILLLIGANEISQQ